MDKIALFKAVGIASIFFIIDGVAAVNAKDEGQAFPPSASDAPPNVEDKNQFLDEMIDSLA